MLAMVLAVIALGEDPFVVQLTGCVLLLMAVGFGTLKADQNLARSTSHRPWRPRQVPHPKNP